MGGAAARQQIPDIIDGAAPAGATPDTGYAAAAMPLRLCRCVDTPSTAE